MEVGNMDKTGVPAEEKRQVDAHCTESKNQWKESKMRECSLGHKITPLSIGGEFEKVLKIAWENEEE